MNRRIFCKSNGFTLIELLVVVAIIGILAAVGVVAYSGYTSAAKIRVVKANHRIVHNWIQSEIMKCAIYQDPWYPILKGNTKGAGFYCNKLNAFNVANYVEGSDEVLRELISNPYGCSEHCKRTQKPGTTAVLDYGNAPKIFHGEPQIGVIYLQIIDDDGNDAFSKYTATGIKVTSCNKLPCDPTTGEGYMKTTFAVDPF